MLPNVVNAVLSILGIIIASNFCSAFGINATPEFVVIAALCSAILATPMTSATICFLIVATVADISMSGPPGLVALIAVITYLAIRGLLFRIQPQRFLTIAIAAAVATFAFHALLACVYSFYYPDAQFWHLFLVNDWKCALLTAFLAPIMIILTNKCTQLLQKTKKRKGLS